MSATAEATEPRDRESEILDAVLVVLARDGVGGASMRAVAKQAGVSLGLAHYYFTDRTSLICAALQRIGERDLDIVGPVDGLPATEQLIRALGAVADAALLDKDYLALRLQLWSLARVDRTYGEINRRAQQRYLAQLTALLGAARPDLPGDEIERRATEILVIQNGIWLTTAILDDQFAIESGIHRCETIAFAE